MRLDNPYTGKPQASPTVEFDKFRAENQCQETFNNQKVESDSEDLLSLSPALRLERLQEKLRQQRENEQKCKEQEISLSQRTEWPLNPEQPKALEPSLKSPDIELRELEEKLRIDLQSVYIAPVVRRQKSKQNSRINEFPVEPSQILGLGGGIENKPENQRINNANTTSSPNTCEFNREVQCCDGVIKYDRKNLYLLLNNNTKTTDPSKADVYWASKDDFIAKERHYGPQNIWCNDEEPVERIRCKNGLDHVLSNIPEHPVTGSSKLSNSLALNGFSSERECTPSPNLSAVQERPGKLWHQDSPQEYLMLRQRNGYKPRLYDCECHRCAGID